MSQISALFVGLPSNHASRQFGAPASLHYLFLERFRVSLRQHFQANGLQLSLKTPDLIDSVAQAGHGGRRLLLRFNELGAEPDLVLHEATIFSSRAASRASS